VHKKKDIRVGFEVDERWMESTVVEVGRGASKREEKYEH
jgi:hypothetical protein